MNKDQAVVDGFGDEWSRFDQRELDPEELESMFQAYFAILPWERLGEKAVGFDLGCGSGRWARCVAPRVGKLHCIDASREALEVARKALASAANCEFAHASVEQIPLADGSMDFGYSLGVLHHVPDTEAGLRACVSKLKPGAPFLLYLYYALDGRPAWFRALWKASDSLRNRISRMPHSARYAASQMLAVSAYYPLARAAKIAEKLGYSHVDSLPLAAYRDRSFYTMRTDALDRFGTRLERRFTREQMRAMMERAGLRDIRFSESSPYWVGVGFKSA
jgi:ubiquinone/menaquinone biosynthesis C-methylase UbiE